MLVYENYNKFISATDTIKRMKSNIVGMESNMEQLLEKIMSVQSKSDGVNTSLFEKREHIEKLHRTRNLLRKVQFIYDLPTGAIAIFKIYGDSSFQDCRKASEEAIALITKKLQGKLFSDSESIQARAEAAMLLKRLNFPVDNLKVKLLEKLEQSLGDFSLQNIGAYVSVDSGSPSPESGKTEVSSNSVHEVLVREFAEAIRAYRVIFPDSENRLISLSRDLITRNFETAELYVKERIPSYDVLHVIKTIWTDVLLLHDVLPEAALNDRFFEATKVIVKKYIASRFLYLLSDISDVLRGKEDGSGEVYSLPATLESSKKGVLQGSMDVLVDFQQFLDDKLELLVNLRDLIVDWVQEGFQDFFWKLDERFFKLSVRKISNQDKGLAEGAHDEKGLMSLVLILSQLCLFIEQSAIPRITGDIAASFSGGGSRGYESGPAFVPGEIRRRFRSAGEKFLHLYINMSTQRLSVILRKRMTTPNWVKHKEPREVHMFVDMLMQELEGIGSEVKQLLPQGLIRKHRRSDSNGSTTSSRSNPLRDDKISRSNTQRARSQLLETHLAKLFKQKVEIFTKVEFTQVKVHYLPERTGFLGEILNMDG
ncbi:hypothetical protein MLD38_028148 [Melastoma candidum]|uniref:Uncharacterized protein n=1 Tax=Melastoma candidum TaxID=119954 RepID=A0ACB9MZX5_9MYRT|nr:hypothetical protein MLD38_028148 [Melastoma candidum]